MTITAFDWQIIATGVIKGITCKNVFWYTASDSDVEASDVFDAFTTLVLPAIATVQSSDYTWTEVTCKNLVNPSGYYVGDVTIVGERGADSSPTFNCWYIRYFRPTTLVHDGRKAIAGVADADVTDGAIATALGVTMDEMTDVLLTPIEPAGGIFMYPAIAKTEPYTNPENGKTYRVPVELFGVNRIEYRRVSTQNSRKR